MLLTHAAAARIQNLLPSDSCMPVRTNQFIGEVECLLCLVGLRTS